MSKKFLVIILSLAFYSLSPASQAFAFGEGVLALTGQYTMQRQPITITETPVGCAEGAGPCVECYPKPSSTSASKDVATPRVVPVGVPGIELTPKHVTRRVMLPQWFAVSEEPKHPRKVSKVR